RTLKEEEKLVNSSDWGYDALAFARWRPEYGYFPKQAGFTAQTATIELGPLIRGLPHLCAIHRQLYQDIFDWAGQLREVDIYQG
ncbi:hypothetical protein MJL48_34520, partial [Salmonella enterica subsp. enterica serovar Kentucky]|nr:hypothetical protein [Salmonella enterica subsp. enterica serovar Kentucky]